MHGYAEGQMEELKTLISLKKVAYCWVNPKNIKDEKDYLEFMRHHNTLQTLRYLLDGGIDSRYDNVTQFNFKKLSKDQCVRSLLGS